MVEDGHQELKDPLILKCPRLYPQSYNLLRPKYAVAFRHWLVSSYVCKKYMYVFIVNNDF